MSMVTGFAKDFILNYFPEDFFKDIYITTTAASNQLSGLEDDEIPVKQYPQLSIQPGYNVNYDEATGGPFPMWRRGHYMVYHNRPNSYGSINVFYNDEDQLSIYSIPQRVSFSFDYKIKVESFLHKIDIVNLLRQHLQDNEKFFWNNVNFESQLPNTIVQIIADAKNYDLNEPDEVDDFLKYLKQFSRNHIVEKIYEASGQRVFSYDFASNILISVTSPPEADTKSKEKIDMADGREIIEFSLNMDLWIPNNFVMECNFLPPEKKYYPSFDETKLIIEHYVRLQPPLTKDNRNRISWNKFVTDINKKVDTIDITPLFNKKHMEMINKIIEKKDFDYLNEIFDIDIYRDEKQIKKKDYNINWSEMQIEMIHPYSNYVYNIAIYADMNLLYNERDPEDKKLGFKK
jgi:hypothetical protein